jgi:hypothetical protein
MYIVDSDHTQSAKDYEDGAGSGFEDSRSGRGVRDEGLGKSVDHNVKIAGSAKVDTELDEKYGKEKRERERIERTQKGAFEKDID